jgi:hypothetical protein
MLRHPVVLTTMEEDFRKFGLLKEDEKSGSSATKTSDDDEKVGAGDLGGDEFDPNDGLDEEEREALAEAEAFAEEFDEAYEAAGHEGEFILDPDEMAELEELGDSVELPYGVIESERGEEGDEVDEARMRIHKMSSAERRAERIRKRQPAAKAAAARYRKKPSVQRAMKKHRAKLARSGGAKKGYRLVTDIDLGALSDSVASLVDDVDMADTDRAIAAFANVALIAERLYDTFKETGDEALAEGYAELAKHAASVVEFLESGEDVDMEALEEQFEEFISVLAPGVEAYDSLVNEGEDEGLSTEEDDHGEDEDQKKLGGGQEQE